MTDAIPRPPRMVGINHIAIEVGDLEAALAFYGRLFDIRLRGRAEGAAFVDMGDQFLALMEGPVRAPSGHRHFGLVVDDRSAVRALAEAAGAEMLDGSSLAFVDPWGNRIEVVDYRDVQFTKAEHVLRGLELDGAKSPEAEEQLAEKGMAPDRRPTVPE